MSGARKAGKLFRTGFKSQATYGCEVHGLSPGELDALQRSASACFPPSGKGKSRTLHLLAYGGLLAKPAVAALCRWNLEVWKSASQGDPRAFSLSQLDSHWRASLACKQGSWRAARGPMAVARQEAARIGWAFTFPFELLDASGHKVSLIEVAQMVQDLAVSSHHVCLEAKAAAFLGVAHPPPGRVVVGPIMRVARAKGWTARQAGTIRSAAVGSLWTASRQLAAGWLPGEWRLPTLRAGRRYSFSQIV